jgi:hypothetical protein
MGFLDSLKFESDQVKYEYEIWLRAQNNNIKSILDLLFKGCFWSGLSGRCSYPGMVVKKEGTLVIQIRYEKLVGEGFQIREYYYSADELIKLRLYKGTDVSDVPALVSHLNLPDMHPIELTLSKPQDVAAALECIRRSDKMAGKDEFNEYSEKVKKDEQKVAANGSIRCPKCKSPQIAAGNKGFGLGKAAVGGILLGPAGLLGGMIGSNKVLITCLKCGHKWEAGQA